MRTNQHRPTGWVILGWLLYLTLLLTLVPVQWTEEVIEKEREMILSVYGEATALWIDGYVGDYYGRLFKDTGVQSAIYGYFDFAKADQRTPELAKFGDPVFDYFSTILDRCFIHMELLLQRWVQLQLWLFPLLLAWVPLLMDGYVRWNIRQTNFTFASPILFGYALKAAGLLIMVTMMVNLLPWTLPPALLPLLLFGGCILAWVALSQMQKRL